MISVLAPHVATYEKQLGRVIASGTLPPFEPLVIDFVDTLSKAVFADETMRSLPEMASLAHWLRKAHLIELRSEFEQMRGDHIWLPRGVVLHYAPANVDSLFVYSWLISLLIGNGNIVRLSERRGEQVNLLLDQINRLLQQRRFEPISDRTLMVAYEHDEHVTGRLSQSCQTRIIWGGDESVRKLRAISMNPLANEIVFADRFSLAVLKAGKVKSSDEKVLDDLAKHFFNDSYWFDQLACSSPRLVVWVGNAASCEEAKELFWRHLRLKIGNRKLQFPEVVGIDKLVSAYLSAALGCSDHVCADITGPLTRIHLVPNSSPQFRRLSCGGGLFFETEIVGLEDLDSLLTERDQTLSYFGFSREDLRKLALSVPPRAIDRIVPIGTALTFAPAWDGANLMHSLSREITIQ